MNRILKQTNESRTRLWVLLFLGLLGGYGLTALPVVAAPFAYVTNGGDNSVSVIDTTTNTVVGDPIPVGSFPIGVAVTPDGKHAYVVNVDSNSVSVIDTTTNTVVGDPIPVGSGPVGVAVTPDGKHAYVTNGRNNSVSVIDTTTNTVVGDPISAMGWYPNGVAVTPDGKHAYQQFPL